MKSRLWIAIDCETTGLLPDAKLLEIGAVTFQDSGAIEGKFERLVRPPVPIPDFITAITGISEEMVAVSEPAISVISEFKHWIPRGGVLVGHNISFDLAVLNNEDPTLLVGWRWSCVDSLNIARRLGEFPNNRLDTIAEVLGMSSNGRRHRAFQDALAVRMLMLHALSNGLDESHPEVFEGIPARSLLAMR